MYFVMIGENMYRTTITQLRGILGRIERGEPPAVDGCGPLVGDSYLVDITDMTPEQDVDVRLQLAGRTRT